VSRNKVSGNKGFTVTVSRYTGNVTLQSLAGDGREGRSSTP